MTQFSLMREDLAKQIATMEHRQLLFVIGYMWSRISLLSNSAVADDAASVAWGYAAGSQFAGTLPDSHSPSQGCRSGGALSVAPLDASQPTP